LVFLNESNQYDLSVDGSKFSSLYSGPGGQTAQSQDISAQPTGGAMNLSRIANTQNQGQDQGFGFSSNTNPAQGQGFGPAHDPYAQSVSYENPDRIFNAGGGVGDFKFDGFGKESWGLYSSGVGANQGHRQADPFDNPFGNVPKQNDPFSPDVNFTANQDNSKGGIWTRDAPTQPAVVEDNKKGKKGFM
jgi:hypothetical protein